MASSKEISPVIITSSGSEQFTTVARSITEILEPIGFSESATNPLVDCISGIYSTQIAKALVIDISLRYGGLISPALDFAIVLKEREDHNNKEQTGKIYEIAKIHSNFSRLIRNEGDLLETLNTFVHIYGPSVDPLSESSEISEMYERLQRVGFTTKRTLAYLVFEEPNQ